MRRGGAIGAVVILASLLLMVAGFGRSLPDAKEQVAKANSFSRGPIGHHAFIAFLKELGYSVRISRSPRRQPADDETLFLLEPDPGQGGELLDAARKRGGRVFVALPKWRGGSVVAGRRVFRLVSEDRAARALTPWTELPIVGRDAQLGVPFSVQDEGGSRWPVRLKPAQTLFEDRWITPLLRCDAGLILGRIRGAGGAQVYCLTDPGLLSNRGLRQIDNARLMAHILEQVVGPSGRIVVDETIHGFQSRPNLLQALTRWPLGFLSLQIVVLLLVLIWLSSQRFGGLRRSDQGIQAGKGALIDNIARLQCYAGHLRHALGRYYAHALREVARGEHLSGNDPAELETELDRRRELRGLRPETAELGSQVRAVAKPRREGSASSEADLLALAGRIDSWMKEMNDGPKRTLRSRG